ncbi:MAG: ribonuclease HIII [Victivallaceae bacterium]|nr:ribonuclease HIII [Victivallaceae bacterium]
MPPQGNGYVCKTTREENAALRRLLEARGWEFSEIPYAEFRAVSAAEHVGVVAYTSGKLVVQGRGTEDFVRYLLEPELVHTFTYGYTPEEAAGIEVAPHGGVDESGKGDFFGPLVVAAVYADAETAPLLRKIGACDSKQGSSNRKRLEMARAIREAIPGRFTVLTLKPETYNRLYSEIGNLNRLLAWGHARSIENLLELVPDCPRMLSDKFGNEILIRRALMERGRRIKLDQQVRAESDVAVAAASFLAREGFLRGMEKLSAEIGVELPRGAGRIVKETGRRLLAERGRDIFAHCAKLHFKTYAELCDGL